MDKRLFVGIGLPELVTRDLADLDPHIKGVRWLAPEQMHLTVSFLGQVEESMAEVLKEKLRAIRWHWFFLPITGLGSFPAQGRPSIIWAGTGAGHPHLFQLHKRVQEAVLAAGLEPDLRAWRPHITLARCQGAAPHAVQHFVKKHAGFEAGLVRVAEFSLFSSRPTPAGSAYQRELTLTL